MLADDLPRPPEVHGSLKGAAQLEPGGCVDVDEGNLAVDGGEVLLLPADLPRPPEAQGEGADRARLIVGFRRHLARLGGGEAPAVSRLSDEVWLARLEAVGVDINGSLARYAAAHQDDVEGARLLGASPSTACSGSHRNDRHYKRGKRGKRV